MSKPTKHAERAHALLSASSAYRWLVCTPSAKLEDEFSEDEEDSIYALEGTYAHELAEVEIGYAADLMKLEDYVARKNELRKSDFYSEEMVEEVAKYEAHVLDVWKEAKKADRFAALLLEDRIDLTTFVPEGFGRNDVVIISGSALRVIDLKFGKGVRVSAEENPQLKLYAIGALEKHGILYDIEEVTLTIHQPRLNSVSNFTLTADDLTTWGEEVVRPTAAIAFEGGGEFVAGDHCHFCKVAPRCRALAEKNLEVAKYDFEEPTLLTDAQLVDIYDRADLFTKWLNKVTGYILKEALAGKSWQGYKLVEGRANRVITNETAVRSKLRGEGYPFDDILNQKLKGLGDLEKLLGKEGFKKLVGPYVIKPEGKPTLVSADDPRPAFNAVDQYKKDFEDEEENI